VTDYYGPRRDRNHSSKLYAEHDTEPWSCEEEALLTQWDGTEDELILTAEVLGRTIEACRQRYYEVRRRGTFTSFTKTTTTTTTSCTWRDADDWNPDWYVRG
jgi:hypothetical protein